MANQAFKNFLWRFSERIGAQVISFLVSIILARLLSPEDYGTISIVIIFITIANVFVTEGLTSSLIQKKNVTQLDFSTMFYFNLLISIVLFILVYSLSPLISKFFNMSILASVLRILAIKIPLASVGAIQQAYVSRNLMFKRFFYSTLVGTIFSAILGISMAINGYGIWSLVVQDLSNIFINNIVLWVTVKWRPTLQFSLANLKELLSYGSNILGANLVITFYNEVRTIIIGKLYSPADLAFYNRGKQFPSLIEGNVNSTISSVLFPILSRAQDNQSSVKELTRKSIKIGSYIMWPLMIGLAVLAEPVVLLLLTDKWSNSVIYLQLYCLNYGLMPVQTANMQAIKATGNSGTYLKIEVIKRIIGFIVLLLVMRMGITAIVVGNLVTSVAFSVINSYPNKYLLNYSLKEQWQDMLPSFLLSLGMGIIVYIVSRLFDNNILKIAFGSITGIVFYLSVSLLTNNTNLTYLLNNIRIKSNRRTVR